ncbi:DegT/DnrJ/EryC1/StrS family aminotransferase, partial [Pseudomonas sp. DP16D-R1]|uniref:DegT/DnrJ/EryC1/StrS family aminotransferase n=1 Tax=Pseudomonas sp. DP16D-R1 TaxID=2075551 RepID=UPI003531C660
MGFRGTLGVFSFNGNKMLTTGGGGMLCTRDKSLAERAQYLAFQAKAPGIDYVHEELGYNFKLSNVLAAIGR